MASANPMPQLGDQIGSGMDGVVYQNLDNTDTVVKVFHQPPSNPKAAQLEFDNLENARRILPDNVVQIQSLADPTQGWLVKEIVLEDDIPKTQQVQDEFAAVCQALQGIKDSRGNLLYGHTPSNPTPRWILIE